MLRKNNPLCRRIARMRKSLAPDSAIIPAAVALTVLLLFYSRIDCLIKAVIGIPCPGCGMTRALMALLRLDFTAAFRYHPMVFIAVPYLAVLAVLLAVKKTTIRRNMPFLIVVAAGMLAVYIIRMILYFPHAEPMTYNEDSAAAVLFRVIRVLAAYAAGGL